MICGSFRFDSPSLFSRLLVLLVFWIVCSVLGVESVTTPADYLTTTDTAADTVSDTTSSDSTIDPLNNGTTGGSTTDTTEPSEISSGTPTIEPSSYSTTESTKEWVTSTTSSSLITTTQSRSTTERPDQQCIQYKLSNEESGEYPAVGYKETDTQLTWILGEQKRLAADQVYFLERGVVIDLHLLDIDYERGDYLIIGAGERSFGWHFSSAQSLFGPFEEISRIKILVEAEVAWMVLKTRGANKRGTAMKFSWSAASTSEPTFKPEVISDEIQKDSVGVCFTGSTCDQLEDKFREELANKVNNNTRYTDPEIGVYINASSIILFDKRNKTTGGNDETMICQLKVGVRSPNNVNWPLIHKKTLQRLIFATGENSLNAEHCENETNLLVLFMFITPMIVASSLLLIIIWKWKHNSFWRQRTHENRLEFESEAKVLRETANPVFEEKQSRTKGRVFSSPREAGRSSVGSERLGEVFDDISGWRGARGDQSPSTARNSVLDINCVQRSDSSLSEVAGYYRREQDEENNQLSHHFSRTPRRVKSDLNVNDGLELGFIGYGADRFKLVTPVKRGRLPFGCDNPTFEEIRL